jgi:DNA topoisomerase-1
MGRGEHPLRGSWKAGASESDVTLNLSPDAPPPEGNWKERIWQPDYMWIASWEDKLNGKRKYVWLSDAYDVKQTRDIEKFDKAVELESAIKKVAGHIATNLKSADVTTRKIATVCYLIDVLKLRVGDEKDKDEADTVGATTLRPEHITFGANGLTTFDFLGKDSVRWQKEVALPEIVVKNLQEFMSKTESSIFKGIRSKNVSLFLDGVMPGLTAKVFRTYHASKAVKDALHKTEVKKADPEYVKKHVATMANLQAAIICNHKKKIPKNWQESLQKKKDRLKKIKASKKTKRNAEAVEKLRMKIEEMKTTKDYNLRTSLKSYIDPRIYYDWGKEIYFDWKIYYPKALQTKFSWIEKQDKA